MGTDETPVTSVRVRFMRDSANPPPACETADSAGMDLRADLPEPVVLEPGGRALIPTGLRLQIPRGYEGQVRPRSGLALKRGLTVLNSPGTIDADYRGDVGVILINHSNEDQRIESGDRIAQIIFAPVTRAELEEADELDDSARSAGGFGSTGER